MQEVCTAMHFAKGFMKSGTAKTVAAVVVPTALHVSLNIILVLESVNLCVLVHHYSGYTYVLLVTISLIRNDIITLC